MSDRVCVRCFGGVSSFFVSFLICCSVCGKQAAPLRVRIALFLEFTLLTYSTLGGHISSPPPSIFSNAKTTLKSLNCVFLASIHHGRSSLCYQPIKVGPKVSPMRYCRFGSKPERHAKVARKALDLRPVP